MQIKFIEEYTNPDSGEVYSVGTVVEVPEGAATSLIEAGTAVAYTEDEAVAEEEKAVKSLQTKLIKQGKSKMTKEEFKSKSFENKKDYIVEKHGEHFVGKAFKGIVQKAVTGQNEAAAADGGNLIFTAISEVMGIAIDGSKVWAKCPKITLPAQANSIKIPTDNSDPWITANTPVPDVGVSEGAQASATKVQFGAETLTLGKTLVYIPSTEELLQDAKMIDAYVRNYARGKLATTLDYEILVGSAGGYAAISGNANTTGVTITETAPTLAQVYQMINAVDPRLQDGGEFFLSSKIWAAIVAQHGTAANLFHQLIDIRGKKLVGYPITVMSCLNDVAIFGNLSQYQVAVPSNNDTMQVSEHIRFDYDEVVFKLRHRGSGAIVYNTKTTADSNEISAFSEGT